MQFKLLLLLGVAALPFIPTASANNNTGWYIGVEGGGNRINDTSADFSTTPPAPPFSGPVDLTFHDGWAALGTAGYAFPGNWRLEAEAGYRHNKLHAVTQSDTGITQSSHGDLNTISLMGNLIYDIPITSRFTASIGAGAGGVRRDFNDKFLVRDHDMKFAYQGIAGLNYAISDGTELTLNYRYLRAAGASFHQQNGVYEDAYRTDDIDNQAITVGLRFDLHPEHAREVAPMPLVEATPQPMQAAPPPPPPRQFLVFFGFNKSNLTSEAQGVVSNAAAAAKQFGSASLVVVGHADTVGSDNYNQKLSERRSAVVRAALMDQGIDASKISASGRGETSLLVQTADNVKEPQNRRATIDLE